LAGYGKLTEELAASGRYDTKDDFTVVWQPFFKDFQPPRLANGKIDTTYFAPDCFHFSSKSHGFFYF
jgi:phospholipase B1